MRREHCIEGDAREGHRAASPVQVRQLRSTNICRLGHPDHDTVCMQGTRSYDRPNAGYRAQPGLWLVARRGERPWAWTESKASLIAPLGG